MVGIDRDPYEEHKARYNAEQNMKSQDLGTTANVILKGINIPFLDLVVLLVKVAFAAIPAGIIIMVVWATLISFITNMF